MYEPPLAAPQTKKAPPDCKAAAEAKQQPVAASPPVKQPFPGKAAKKEPPVRVAPKVASETRPAVEGGLGFGQVESHKASSVPSQKEAATPPVKVATLSDIQETRETLARI